MGRRPIAAAGGSICYSHGRDLAAARPAHPPQPRDQLQVRPAAVLASRGGGGGADMELRVPRGLPHRALCGEQGKTPLRAAGRQRKREKQVLNHREGGKPRPPAYNSPPNGEPAEKEFPYFVTLSVIFHSADSQVHRFLSDHFCFSWARVGGLVYLESRRQLSGGPRKREWVEKESGHQGARGWPGIGA